MYRNSNRGRGRGSGDSPPPKDPYEFRPELDDEYPPLGRRIGIEKIVEKTRRRERLNNAEKQFEEQAESDQELQEAIEASKKSAEDEKKRRQKAYLDDTLYLAGVISEDEDESEDEKAAAAKPPRTRFKASSESSKATGRRPPAAHSAKSTVDVDVSVKVTATRSKAQGDTQSQAKAKKAQPKAAGQKRAEESNTGGNFFAENTEKWLHFGSQASTKPKSIFKSYVNAVGSSTSAKPTDHQPTEAEETKDVAEMKLEPGMRFNPFTFRMEPIPNFDPLPRLEYKATETTQPRMLLPHDMTTDRNGRPVTTPEEKARAWTEYLDDQYRKIHEQNLHVRTVPSQTVTYREGECLGSKGRSSESDTSLSMWQERNFPDGLSDDQRKWIIENQEYRKNLAAEKAAEEVAAMDE